MIAGSIIFSAGCALTHFTISKVGFTRLFVIFIYDNHVIFIYDNHVIFISSNIIIRINTTAIVFMIIALTHLTISKVPSIIINKTSGVVDGGSNLWFCVGFWPEHRTHTHLDNGYEVVPKK